MRTRLEHGCQTCGKPIRYKNSLCLECLEEELGCSDTHDPVEDYEEDRRRRLAESQEY